MYTFSKSQQLSPKSILQRRCLHGHFCGKYASMLTCFPKFPLIFYSYVARGLTLCILNPDKHLRKSFFHFSVHLNLCNGHSWAEVERSKHRGLVEKWAILGHRWCVCAPVCRSTGSAQGFRRYRHKLYGHIQGIRWWGLWRAIRF